MEFAKKVVPYAPDGYDKFSSVLYVGKATRGSCQKLNPKWLYKECHWDFWRFARRVGEAVDPKCKFAENVIWTNLFKLGTTVGNPAGRFVESQLSTAAADLRTDIRLYKPNIIVMVNAYYHEDITNSALEINPDADDNHASQTIELPFDEKYCYWYRRSFTGKEMSYPPLVWLRHPQGKPKAFLDRVLECMTELVREESI